MAETLLAVLFVTSSARGSNLVFRWPPFPSAPLRLSRALSEGQGNVSEASYKRRIPSSSDLESSLTDACQDTKHRDEYDEVFGYSSEFLAGILCPHTSMCHQKFELIVDDLAFIGHPVCADRDGTWRFKTDKSKVGSRGRESRNRQTSQPEGVPRPSSSPRSQSADKTTPTNKSTWLNTFHLVMVLDLPDPTSSAAGNVSKYFDVIYEQAAFTIAAVLFQEQVLSNFVERECDQLGSLKDDCMNKVTSFTEFCSQAMETSSLAPAMKALYESIKSSSIGHISLNNILVEVQLPPHLDVLLHNDDDFDHSTFNNSDDEDLEAWGPEMRFGWRLPALVPWKSLLLLDPSDDFDPFSDLRNPRISPDDQGVAEGLLKFLETANVTLSLADLASLLDWELESQIYPIVRWLVQHRRAKVVDVVHSGLKTVFTLPPKFDTKLSDLITQFASDFADYDLPPLPHILSDISTAAVNQTGNHFFASVVRSKDLIPFYHEVVVWMLKRDMLVTLHLRIRIVASAALKANVRSARAKSREKKKSRRRDEARARGGSRASSYRSGVTNWLNLPPLEERPIQRVPSVGSSHSELSELVLESDEQDDLSEDYVEGMESSDGREDSGWETGDDERYSSIIIDPGRATPLQRRWLSGMSVGKDHQIARRFELINQYFDGRRTDDEILYKAEITRRQLREVLHHYDEYLQTFLHPS
ncbi:Nitrogen permease regulator 3 [Marasmius crinis-equi]|uniref:Nitrogen permease regulator 3 n=1 Tax=Marasmius crinis-equi TaxID=585013 RepID=A0ABR3FDM2_9AGAR